MAKMWILLHSIFFSYVAVDVTAFWAFFHKFRDWCVFHSCCWPINFCPTSKLCQRRIEKMLFYKSFSFFIKIPGFCRNWRHWSDLQQWSWSSCFETTSNCCKGNVCCYLESVLRHRGTLFFPAFSSVDIILGELSTFRKKRDVIIEFVVSSRKST